MVFLLCLWAGLARPGRINEQRRRRCCNRNNRLYTERSELAPSPHNGVAARKGARPPAVPHHRKRREAQRVGPRAEPHSPGHQRAEHECGDCRADVQELPEQCAVQPGGDE